MATVEKHAAVGWRVRVFWEGDDEWFEGVVKEYSAESGYFVQYDDGEEQWEAAEVPGSIQFLCGPSSTPNEAQLILAVQQQEEEEEEEAQNIKWSAEPPPSTRGDEDEGYEDEYEEDHDGEDDKGTYHAGEPLARSPKPEANEEYEDKEAIALPPKRSAPPLRQPRDPTKYVKSGIFLRDPETLREMKMALSKEKKELQQQVDDLSSDLQRKQQLSSALKNELHGLKALVTLADLTSSSKDPKRKAPKTATDWAEAVIEQKNANRDARAQLSNLQSHLTKKQMTIQKQRDELQTKLSRVPRKELCSLVDVQVEIAQLLDEKRELETQLAKKLAAEKPAKPKLSSTSRSESTQDQRDTKTELEKELRSLEKQAMRARDDVDQWRLAYEKENAKLAPVKSRLASLQEELHRYERSQVLLRSVFLRLDRSCSGSISLEAALEAFRLLVPDDRNEITQQLRQSVKSKTLDFATFTECFQQFVSQ